MLATQPRHRLALHVALSAADHPERALAVLAAYAHATTDPSEAFVAQVRLSVGQVGLGHYAAALHTHQRLMGTANLR